MFSLKISEYLGQNNCYERASNSMSDSENILKHFKNATIDSMPIFSRRPDNYIQW